MREACDVMDRLVDIDPYDYRNQERIAKLEGKVDPGFLQNMLARAAKAATVSSSRRRDSGARIECGTAAPGFRRGARATGVGRFDRAGGDFPAVFAATKAVERLERIAQIFPGEEEKNERLRALYDRANWWPPRRAVTPGRTHRAEQAAGRLRPCLRLR